MPLIFISHAAADAEIAEAFRADITNDFLGMCDIFVSSNLDSIQGGAEWNQVIKKNLLECDILIGLLSPLALTRPWIYAEFGAGWIRGIPTIPVCHSSLDRGHLPPPLSSFQGLNLIDNLHLDHLYGQIAGSIGCKQPKIDTLARIVECRKITEKVHAERVIIAWARQFFEWNPGLVEKLKHGEMEETALVPENLDQPFREFVNAAAERSYLQIDANGFAIGTRVGTQAAIYRVEAKSNFDELLDLIN